MFAIILFSLNTVSMIRDSINSSPHTRFLRDSLQFLYLVFLINIHKIIMRFDFYFCKLCIVLSYVDSFKLHLGLLAVFWNIRLLLDTKCLQRVWKEHRSLK